MSSRFGARLPVAVVLLALVVFGAAGASSAFASHVVINFDTLPNLALVTNQYPGVTFSSTAGNANRTTDQAALYGTSSPNFLCAGPFSGFACDEETILTFSPTVVRNLTFMGDGANNVGTVALVDVVSSTGRTTTVPITSTVGGVSPLPPPISVDLSSYGNIARIRIHDITDGGGIGWDDFSYDTTSIKAPPPPPAPKGPPASRPTKP